MNTIFEYKYRDANNYKVHEDVVFVGELTETQIKDIYSALDGGEFFIPGQVDLESLEGQLQVWDTQDWGDDHCWHEVDEIYLTDSEPTDSRTVQEFYSVFIKAGKEGWNEIEVGHILNNA